MDVQHSGRAVSKAPAGLDEISDLEADDKPRTESGSMISVEEITHVMAAGRLEVVPDREHRGALGHADSGGC
jgi:hypothetical protein